MTRCSVTRRIVYAITLAALALTLACGAIGTSCYSDVPDCEAQATRAAAVEAPRVWPTATPGK